MSKKLHKKHWKIIVDAERHRRTPGTPATWSKEMGSEKSAGFRDIGGNKCTKSEPNGTKREPTGPKWLPKSMLNPWKIEVAARMRFWSGHWQEKGQRKCYGDGPFGDHFGPKSEKRHPKSYAKIDAEKVLKINAKSDPKWSQNGDQNQQIFKLFRKRLKCSKLFVLQ